MLSISELRQTRVYQDAVQEGIEQGRTQIILCLLSKKFGSLSPQIRLDLQHLSSQQVDDLADNLLAFSSLDDFLSWLESSQNKFFGDKGK